MWNRREYMNNLPQNPNGKNMRRYDAVGTFLKTLVGKTKETTYIIVLVLPHKTFYEKSCEKKTHKRKRVQYNVLISYILREKLPRTLHI